MKRLALRLALFVLLGFCLLNILAYLSFIVTPLYLSRNWGNILKTLQQSRTPMDSDIVYLGDSVAQQLYSGDRSANSLATTSGVSMVGHYILAHNAIIRNPRVRTVVLATVPNNIGYRFEESLTYNNLLKPFFTFSNLRHFSPLILSKMRRKPLSFLSILPIVKVATMFSDVDFQEGPATVLRTGLSDISIEYLKRLVRLAEIYNAKLVLVSPPTRMSHKAKTNDWEALRSQAQKEGLGDLFEGYFRSIHYVDDGNFTDYNHLQASYLSANRQAFLRNMVGGDIFRQLTKDVAARLGAPVNPGDREPKAGRDIPVNTPSLVPTFTVKAGSFVKDPEGYTLSPDSHSADKIAWTFRPTSRTYRESVRLAFRFKILDNPESFFLLMGPQTDWASMMRAGMWTGTRTAAIESLFKKRYGNGQYKVLTAIPSLRRFVDAEVAVDFKKRTILFSLDGAVVLSSAFTQDFDNISFVGFQVSNGRVLFTDISEQGPP
jgi:hypothetical protein